MGNTTVNKFYTVDKEINGTKYKAQFNGLSAALEAVDNCYVDGKAITSSKKMSEYVLTHVIVEPSGLKIDDFETIEELNEVISFGKEVMQGRFRDKKSKTTTRTTD